MLDNSSSGLFEYFWLACLNIAHVPGHLTVSGQLINNNYTNSTMIQRCALQIVIIDNITSHYCINLSANSYLNISYLDLDCSGLSYHINNFTVIIDCTHKMLIIIFCVPPCQHSIFRLDLTQNIIYNTSTPGSIVSRHRCKNIWSHNRQRWKLFVRNNDENYLLVTVMKIFVSNNDVCCRAGVSV